MSVDVAAQIWYGIKRNPPDAFLHILEEEENNSTYEEWVVDGIHITRIYNYDTVIGWGAIVAVADDYNAEFDVAKFLADADQTKRVVDKVFEPFVLEEDPKMYFIAVYR